MLPELWVTLYNKFLVQLMVELLFVEWSFVEWLFVEWLFVELLFIEWQFVELKWEDREMSRRKAWLPFPHISQHLRPKQIFHFSNYPF